MPAGPLTTAPCLLGHSLLPAAAKHLQAPASNSMALNCMCLCPETFPEIHPLIAGACSSGATASNHVSEAPAFTKEGYNGCAPQIAGLGLQVLQAWLFSSPL